MPAPDAASQRALHARVAHTSSLMSSSALVSTAAPSRRIANLLQHTRRDGADWLHKPEVQAVVAGPTRMTVDFARSFLTFRIDQLKKEPITAGHSFKAGETRVFNLNNARVPLECIADLVHKPTGGSQRVVLGASCKTERCFVPEGVWFGADEGLAADFVPVGSSSNTSTPQWLVIKTYDTVGKAVPIASGPNAGTPQPNTGSYIEHSPKRCLLSVRDILLQCRAHMHRETTARQAT